MLRYGERNIFYMAKDIRYRFWRKTLRQHFYGIWLSPFAKVREEAVLGSDLDEHPSDAPCAGSAPLNGNAQIQRPGIVFSKRNALLYEIGGLDEPAVEPCRNVLFGDTVRNPPSFCSGGVH